MKFRFDNNRPYYVKQKMQRMLKNTCKILLTLSLSYAISTKFISTSFAVITKQNIRNTYVNPQYVSKESLKYDPYHTDLKRQISVGPFINTMVALLPADARMLKGEAALKALLKCVMGGFMVDPHAADNQEDITAALKMTDSERYSDRDVLREAIETIVTDDIINSRLQLSDELFYGKKREENQNGTKLYTKEQTINYLINVGYATTAATVATLNEDLYIDSIPIEYSRTQEMVKEIKEELDPVVANWTTNTYLLEKLQEESDNKYVTCDESLKKLNTYIDKISAEDLNRLKVKISESTRNKLTSGRKISELNLTEAELREIKYALDDELRQKLKKNSSKITKMAQAFTTATQMVQKLEVGKAAIDNAENTINEKKNQAVKDANYAINNARDQAILEVSGLIGTKQTEAISSIENKQQVVENAIGDKQKLTEKAIAEQRNKAIRGVSHSIVTQRNAATTLIDTKQTEAIKSIENKQKDAVAAAETAITAKKDTIVLEAGTAITQQQNAATTLIGTKQTEAISSIENKQQVVENAIGDKQKLTEKAIAEQRNKAIRGVSHSIVTQRNAATTLIDTKQTEAIKSIENKQKDAVAAAETAITAKKDTIVLEAGTAITQQQNAATTLIGTKQTEAISSIENKQQVVENAIGDKQKLTEKAIAEQRNKAIRGVSHSIVTQRNAATTLIDTKQTEAIKSIENKQKDAVAAAETAITAKKDTIVLEAGTAITQQQNAATTLIGTKQTEAISSIENKQKDAVAAAETAITAKKDAVVLEAGTAITQQQNAATTLIGTKQTEAISSIENKQKDAVAAAETAITAKKDAVVLEAGTAITQQQNAATTLIGTKQTEAIKSVENKQKAAETDISDKKDEAVKAIDDKQKEAIESTENTIQRQKDEVVWALISLEKKKMQISEAQAQELKKEQEKLEERIIGLEQKLNKVSNDERELSKEEVQELKEQCDELKQELKMLQGRLSEGDQEERQTSEAEVKRLKEEQDKLANELQTVKKERIAEAQKSQEEQKAKEKQKAHEDQKIIEEKIAQEVKQREELEHTNNKVARSQDVASNVATSIKSMEMLSHAVSLAVSQLVGDRISNITQTNSSEGKDLVAQMSKRKIVASGSQVAHINEVTGTSLRPKSWDIWGGTHIGTISQDAINNYGATSKTRLHGFVLGIDKIFGYNLLGFAISYGQSLTKYTVPQFSTNYLSKSYNPSHYVNAEQQNSYYQASMYVRYSPNDRFFIQLLGGLGTYAQNARINNLFSNSNDTSGHSVNTTIGYHYYSSEQLVLTPTLGIFYNYLNIPGQSNTNTTSSFRAYKIISKIDATIGLNIKLMSTGNVMNNNVRIIPEVTAAIKFRIHENQEEKAQVPMALIMSADDLLANIAAAPSQLMQVGARLTIGNDTVLLGIYGHADIAVKYHALTCGINVKLYL